jgi:uncharacterized protein YkwD
MLRKTALIFAIFAFLLLTQARPVSASNAYHNLYSYFSTILSLLRFTNNHSLPELTSSIFYIKNLATNGTDNLEEESESSTKVESEPTAPPTVAIIPTNYPTATPQPVLGETSVGSTAHMLNEINIYRKSQGLPEVRTDPHTCNFAKIRAQEISTSFSHEGFQNRMNTNSLPYPSYSEVTENIAMHSDYSAVVPMWIGSPGHEANLKKNTSFACIAQHGSYFAYEGWQP